MPIIADIPLIGDLFRYDSVAEERRELLIILTPQIIYTKMDSDLAKQIESSRMSWMLSDVLNMHGEAGLRSRCDEWYDGEMESVFPNVVPEEGFLPLSSHKFGPDGQMEMCAPGSDQRQYPQDHTDSDADQFRTAADTGDTRNRRHGAANQRSIQHDRCDSAGGAYGVVPDDCRTVESRRDISITLADN